MRNIKIEKRIKQYKKLVDLYLACGILIVEVGCK